MNSNLWKVLIVCGVVLQLGSSNVFAWRGYCGGCGSSYGYGGPRGYAGPSGYGVYGGGYGIVPPAPIRPMVLMPSWQPVPRIDTSNLPDGRPSSMTCPEIYNRAVAAFQLKNYDMALYLVNRGVAQCPDDSNMLEFQSLVQFARQDYVPAAKSIHTILAAGPGWNWDRMHATYDGILEYTDQIRALETYAREHPGNSPSRFLLAYHYLLGGYLNAAERQLVQLQTLVPNDQVVADMLKKVQKLKLETPAPAEPPTPVPPSKPTPAPPAPGNTKPNITPTPAPPAPEKLQ